MPSSGAKKKTLNFEEGLERMEAIATQMEENELPLDQLLSMYEEGMKLSQTLTKKLESVQGRLMEVQQHKDGKLTAVPSDAISQPSLIDVLDDEGR